MKEFGAGEHKPGAGSAAALMGLLSCRLMLTVITVTERLSNLSITRRTMISEIRNHLTEFEEPFFTKAIQRDMTQFHKHFIAREAQLRSNDPQVRDRLQRIARTELEKATDIPLDIAMHAAETAKRGLRLFDVGAKHVRGDSGVAISTATAACSGALCVVYLNLKGSRGGQWALETRAKADVTKQLNGELQLELLKRVDVIQEESEPKPHMQLQLKMDGA